jgi:hypothetical protein
MQIKKRSGVMATKKRLICIDYFLDEDLGQGDPLAQILFAALWCMADRDGKLKEEPTKIKTMSLPYRECNVISLLKILEGYGCILRYSVAQKNYILIKNFTREQHIHPHEAKSILPNPLEKCNDITGKVGKLQEMSPTVTVTYTYTSTVTDTVANEVRTNGRAVEIYFDTNQKEIWGQAREEGTSIWEKLCRRYERNLSHRDKEEITKALYASKTIFTQDWLADSVEAVYQKKPDKPGAYLRTCLARSAKELGHDYHKLLNLIKIPDDFFKKKTKNHDAPNHE